MLITIFGQMKFWGISQCHFLCELRLNFLEYNNVQSIEGHRIENFSQMEILENYGDSSFQIYAESCMLAMATYSRADWWN